MHRKYRLLERQCQIQLAITGHEETHQELEKLDREYRFLAEWLEAQLPAGQKPCPLAADHTDQNQDRPGDEDETRTQEARRLIKDFASQRCEGLRELRKMSS